MFASLAGQQKFAPIAHFIAHYIYVLDLTHVWLQHHWWFLFGQWLSNVLCCPHSTYNAKNPFFLEESRNGILRRKVEDSSSLIGSPQRELEILQNNNGGKCVRIDSTVEQNGPDTQMVIVLKPSQTTEPEKKTGEKIRFICENIFYWVYTDFKWKWNFSIVK